MHRIRNCYFRVSPIIFRAKFLVWSKLVPLNSRVAFARYFQINVLSGISRPPTSTAQIPWSVLSVNFPDWIIKKPLLKVRSGNSGDIFKPIIGKRPRKPLIRRFKLNLTRSVTFDIIHNNGVILCEFLMFRFNSISSTFHLLDRLELIVNKQLACNAFSRSKMSIFEWVIRSVSPGDDYTIYMLGNGRARYFFCPL